MSTNIRAPLDDKFISPGPYLAKVTNHLDPTYMGSLEVTLLRATPGNSKLKTANIVVRYCSPFFGSTPQTHEGNDSSKFEDVQKSYGFWMIPPDIGCTVVVFFIGGDINQGYWFGCVPDMYQNHMVPGIAASQYSAMTEAQLKKYNTKNVPVAEFHKSSRKGDVPNPDRFTKPVHPFAERLTEQGLLVDTIRGVTSSGARREVPSRVYGISTPGPVDLNAPLKPAGFTSDKNREVVMPTSRLGGHQLVMDDGDTSGKNELFRIRTRTGHQILLHNSSDLIYIGNSKGTAWIELTSAGKIDVYAEDSVSIRTKGDFNFHADRDVNIEAVRNINMATTDGNMNINIRKDINLISDNFLSKTTNAQNFLSGQNTNITVGNNFNLIANSDMKLSSVGITNLISGSTIALSASDNLSMLSSKIVQQAGRIDLNGGSPSVPLAPEPAAIPQPLNLYSVPQRESSSGWGENKFYKAPNLITIMQRAPSHEPWDQHENINPAQFSLSNTDNTLVGPVSSEEGNTIEGSTGANEVLPAAAGPASDRGEFRGKPYPWSTDAAFINKVKEVAASLRFSPVDLLAVMNLETNRTFDPWIQNSLGYTGLIQFGDSAAKDLGTTTDKLRQMTRTQQLDYVEKFFRKWSWPNNKCPNPSLSNIYLTVLLPACRFANLNEKIADSNNPKTRAWYEQNRSFDSGATPKGYFTPEMVEQQVLIHKREVLEVLKKANVSL